MSRVLSLIGIFMLLGMCRLTAFQAPVEIARVNETPIWSDEFLYAFKKNRSPETPVNEDSLLNYLDRFINFKLKVLEARKRGTDTLKSFRDEYEGYIDQVSKPYLDNPNKLDELVAEAYQRSLEEVKVSHILIRTPRNATASDTLTSYQKIDSLRKLVLNGTDFEFLARKNSHDGNANKGGDLGWFTAFSMVYPFETAAYNTSLNGISEIVKTQFGYHLLKVTGRRKARGRVRTSHIFIARNKHSYEEGRQLIQKAYDSLQNGGSWNVICKLYSEDDRSKIKNGALPMAGLGQLPEEYLTPAFEIEQEGTYSAPVETPFGWHIIRLDARQPIPALEQTKNQLAESVRRSGRLQYEEQEVVKQLKAQNDFRLMETTVASILDSMSKFLGQVEKLTMFEAKPLFKIGSKTVYGRDFLSFIQDSPALRQTRNFSSAYGQFEKESVFAYEDSLALIKYPEYRLLLQEYEEGLLLFDIMETEIWNVALSDSSGLKGFFRDHQSGYPAPLRAETQIIRATVGASPELLPRVSEILQNHNLKHPVDSLLKANLSSADYSLLKIVKRTLTRNDLPIFAAGEFTENQLVLSQNKDQLYLISTLIPAGFYTLDEIKGKVTADYQDFLDEQWIKRLRSENKIIVHKRRIASLLPLE